MELLMITRKVDRSDALAGFAFNWVEKIAAEVDFLRVICLEKGDLSSLPANAEVYSLGKEYGSSKVEKIWRFYGIAWRWVRQSEGVFCHMNPEYTILISPLARIFNKRIIAWYSHRAVTWRLRLVSLLADKIATPSQEGLRIKTEKKIVLGHGIDTDRFVPPLKMPAGKSLKIISVGRISPIKDYETLLEAIVLVRQKKKELEMAVEIIGGVAMESQRKYFEEIKKIIEKNNLAETVILKGKVPHYKLADYYQRSDLLINLCPTGSPDKVVLEAMACASPALVCNKAFAEDFGPYADELIFAEKDAEGLADKIIYFSDFSCEKRKEIGLFLRRRVLERHNLEKLAKKIVSLFS